MEIKMVRTAFSTAKALALALLLLFVGSCADDDSAALSKQAEDLAKEFHSAIATRDEKRLASLVDYPFNFDCQLTLDNEDELKKTFFETKRSSVRRAVRAAVKLESATYGQFCDGKPMNSRSLEKDQARKQASKLDFREGGVLVRCFYQGDDGSQDARFYYLAMHKNALGDLKITTYYD